MLRQFEADTPAARYQCRPTGKDGNTPWRKTEGTHAPRSSVFVVEASSSDPAYTQVYAGQLDEPQYLEYKKT